MKRIYLDYAASTPVDPEVVQAMEPFWSQEFANTGGIHQEGVAAQAAVLAARAACASFIHARRPDDVIFTSGATEANNLGFFGVIEAARARGKEYTDLHIITTPIEHRSILDVVKALAEKGVQIDYLSLNEEGLVTPQELHKLLRPETVLVSVGYVNSEIGVIQPVKECARIVREYNCRCPTPTDLVYVHTDATQAPVYLSCDVQSLGVDMMSLGSQKVYGPKGVGLLYVDERVVLTPLLYGGTRERGLRPGTLPTPLLVGFGKALELAKQRREEETKRVTALRNYFIERVLEELSQASLNGSSTKRTPNNANFSFPGIDSELLVLQLDAKGIAVSAKSACSRGGGSHVVRALGKGEEYATSAVRFSLGIHTTKEDIDTTIEALIQCAAQHQVSAPALA